MDSEQIKIHLEYLKTRLKKLDKTVKQNTKEYQNRIQDLIKNKTEVGLSFDKQIQELKQNYQKEKNSNFKCMNKLANRLRIDLNRIKRMENALQYINQIKQELIPKGDIPFVDFEIFEQINLEEMDLEMNSVEQDQSDNVEQDQSDNVEQDQSDNVDKNNIINLKGIVNLILYLEEKKGYCKDLILENSEQMCSIVKVKKYQERKKILQEMNKITGYKRNINRQIRKYLKKNEELKQEICQINKESEIIKHNVINSKNSNLRKNILTINKNIEILDRKIKDQYFLEKSTESIFDSRGFSARNNLKEQDQPSDYNVSQYSLKRKIYKIKLSKYQKKLKENEEILSGGVFKHKIVMANNKLITTKEIEINKNLSKIDRLKDKKNKLEVSIVKGGKKPDLNSNKHNSNLELGKIKFVNSEIEKEFQFKMAKIHYFHICHLLETIRYEFKDLESEYRGKIKQFAERNSRIKRQYQNQKKSLEIQSRQSIGRIESQINQIRSKYGDEELIQKQKNEREKIINNIRKLEKISD